MIPPKPAGSWIAEHFTADACTLKWRLPSSGLKNYMPIVLSAVVLVVVVVQGAAFIPRGGGNPMRWLFLAVPLLVLLPMLKGLRGSRPESVTLGPDYFRHDPGRAGGVWASVDEHRNHGMGGPRVVEIPKAELGEIVIERVGGLLRLRYDVGAERVEIGRYLREPEKEWLAVVIREWQKATGAVREVFAGRPGGVRELSPGRGVTPADPGPAADGGA